ncbi:hypothetical protein FNV43_RR05095 [Rhamnella rubrinervis]|uniref:Uncharacterized protein n=1 Tax=Rhamnella rubrinervis TaxID=2594499 RepID=A0A8K0HKZ5_9ROSA|nr:hypothetical protein FNV43_RR05095 [Rhamnella rubrinervis]
MLSKAKGIGSGFSWDKLSAQLASSVQTKPKETPKVQVATVRGQAKARALPPLKAIVKQTGARFGASSKPPRRSRNPKENRPMWRRGRHGFNLMSLIRQKALTDYYSQVFQ